MALTATELILINLIRIRRTQQQVGPWEPSQYFLGDREKPRNPVSQWPVAGPSRHTPASSQQSAIL
jgi:hypothetical protein